MGPIGIPSVEQRMDAALLKGIPGAFANTPCVLSHRNIGEYFLTFGRAFAGALLFLAAIFIGQLGDGDPGSALPVLFFLYLLAFGHHRLQMWKRSETENVYSMSPGVSYLDERFTAFRMGWKNPPALLQRVLKDNVLLYLVIQPALVFLFAFLLHLGRDVDGARFVFAAGCAYLVQAIRIRTAYRRTVAAAYDAPLFQQALADVTRPAYGRLPVGGTPHIVRGPAIQAADPAAVPAGVVDLLAHQQLARFAPTVTNSVNPIDLPGSNAGSQATQDAQPAQAS